MPDALPPTIHSSILEDLTGLGEKRLRQLSADGVLPARVGRAEWPTLETLRRLIAHYKKKADVASGDEELARKLDLERLRKLRIANAKAAREVIDVESAKKAIGDVLLTFVSKCDDIPDKLAAPLANRPADVIRARIAAELRELREALATPPDFKYADEDPLTEEEAEDDEDTGEPS